MIVDERIVTFINSLDTENSRILEEIEKEAHASDVPVIRREMQSLLKVLLMLQKPMRILEVGTAIGFSALLMSEYAPEGCRITTIENYEKRIPIARGNFARAGKEDVIALIEGDAAQVLETLEGTYDFIFMDAAKGQYIHYLPHVLRLLAEGGCLVSDNVMQDGGVIQSRFAVERRNRTIHARMREYLYELKHNPLLETAILPLGDGAAISVKRNGEQPEEARPAEQAPAQKDGNQAEQAPAQKDGSQAEQALARQEEQEQHQKTEKEGEKQCNEQTSRITDSGKQPGSSENGGYIRRGRGLYRRGSIRPAGEGKKLFHGRDEGRNRIRPCT